MRQIHLNKNPYRTTINDVFEIWKELKRGIRANIFQNYCYLYGSYVGDAINDTKTPASKRVIPMTEGVKEALRLEKEMQDILGVSCEVEINGYTDFVFLNRFGGL